MGLVMLKNLLSILLGYFSMSMFILLTFSTLFIILGTEVSLQPNSYQISFIWLHISIVLTMLASILGGYICIKFANNRKNVYSLAVSILILGLIISFAKISNPDLIASLSRSGEISSIEAMLKAKQPISMMFIHPFISAIGILIGGNVIVKNKLLSFIKR